MKESYVFLLLLKASWRSISCPIMTSCPQIHPMRTCKRSSASRNKDLRLPIAGVAMRYSHTACKRGKCVHVYTKRLSSNTLVGTCVSSVSATDGEADVRVLGSQSGLSPHSPEGQEDPGQDVGVPRHQAVTVQRDGVVRGDAPPPLIADRRERAKKKEEAANNGTKSPDERGGRMNGNGQGGPGKREAEDLFQQWRSALLRREGRRARGAFCES